MGHKFDSLSAGTKRRVIYSDMSLNCSLLLSLLALRSLPGDLEVIVDLIPVCSLNLGGSVSECTVYHRCLGKPT